MRHATRRKSRRCPIGTHSRRVRPMLEQLEDRLTPSTGPGIVLSQTLTAPYGSPDPGHDSSAILTVDGSGRLGMFWQDPSPTGGTVSGEVNGSPTFNAATEVATQGASLLAAAADTNGDIGVVWADAGGTDYISFSSANGTPLGAAIVGSGIGGVSLAGDSVGHFMVTWGGIGVGVSAEVFDARGYYVTPAFAVPNDAYPGNDSWDSSPVVVADTAGGFMVLWGDWEQGKDPQIWAQRYDANGVALNRFGLDDLQYPPDSLGVGAGLTLSAASDGAGNVVLVWTGDTFADGQEPGSSSGTFSTAPAFKRITDQGSVGSWGSIPVDATPPAVSDPPAYGAPSVALDASGGFDVLYNVGNTTYAKRFDASNNVIASLTALAAAAPSPASVVAMPNGNFAIGSLTTSGNAAAAVYTTASVAPPQIVTPLAAADEAAFANVLYYESQSYFTDAAGSALTYTATLANGNSLPSWLSLDSSGRLFGVPGPGVVGTTYQVRLTATDAYGGTAVLTLPITVAPDPTQPKGSAFTVAPVAADGSPAASNGWVNQQAMAVNAAGDAMIVCGMNLGSSGAAIMGQVYNAQHQPVGPVFQVNSTVGGSGNLPTVTADAAGDFDVTWQAGVHTYLQRFSPLGVAVGPVVTTLAAESGLQVVADAAGDLVLLWTSQSGIYMRRFDTQGNALSPTVQVAANGYFYHAAASANGNVMVVWNANQQLETQVFSAQLKPLSSAVAIGGAGAIAATVAADGMGNFDVTFENGIAIEFERFNSLGQPIANTPGGTGPTVVPTGLDNTQDSAPQVAADRSGNFTLIWYGSFSFSGYEFGQRYDPAGRPVGGVFLIPNGVGTTSIASDPAGDLLVTDIQWMRGTLAGQWYWPTATVHVPAAQSTSVSSALVFSTANHNAITLTGGNPMQLETLTLTTGSAATLAVTHTTGLTSSTGNGTATVKLIATSTALNAALQGLAFHPVASALTPTLQVSLALNAAMTVSGSVSITVHVVPPPNVPPKVTLASGPLSVAAGSTLTFATSHADAITLTDPDAGSTLETLTLWLTSGTLKLASTSGVKTVQGNGTGLVRVTGTLSALNTALNGLIYTAAHGASGSALFDAYVVDSGNAMGWASTTLTIAP